MKRLFQMEPLEPTLGGRVTRVLFVATFLTGAAVGALACWAFPRQDRLAFARAARLATAEGTIDGTEVAHHRYRRPRAEVWEVTVRYSFEVKGTTYRGRSLDFSHTSVKHGSAAAAEGFRRRYPDGKRVTVWYDRADPWDSALDRAFVEVTAYVIPAGSVGALCLAIAYLGARDTLRQCRRKPLPEREVRRGLRLGRNAAVAVAAVAAALLAAHLLPQAFHIVRRARLASTDVYLTGDLEVEGDPPVPRVRYFFRTAVGEPFVHGSAWRFGRQSVALREEAEEITRRIGDDYRANRLKVYYLRGDPSVSALSPEHAGPLAPRVAAGSAFALLVAGPAAFLLRRALASRSG